MGLGIKKTKQVLVMMPDPQKGALHGQANGSGQFAYLPSSTLGLVVAVTFLLLLAAKFGNTALP
jgi:hypothetical protein